MFNIVEKNQKLVKGILIVVTASFVLWGVGSYLGMMGDDGYIAKVGNKKIYERDIDNVMQQNKQYTDKMQVLFSLINRQLILNNADSYHLNATKEQLQVQISNIPAFQESGVFVLDKYENFLKSNQLTAAQFQNNIQEQIIIDQVVTAFKGFYFNSTLFNNQFAQLLSQERNISSYVIDPKQFYPEINITDKQISGYYNQNITKYTSPEQVKVQYIKLTPETIQNGIKIPAATVAMFINQHESELANTQVDVSHILFSVPSNADVKTQSNIKNKAEQVLKLVKANPGKFAELAKRYSEDPGSARNGGDLGFFGHGAMAVPFEQVAFNLKPEQISGLVKTQFGYHILKLNARKDASKKDIEQQAIAQLQKQQSASIIQHQVDQLNDLTYNHPDSLEPAAKAMGVSIQTSNWINKNVTQQDDFANPKVQKAVFSDDAVKKHNNSEVIDFGNNIYAVYHVIDYKQAQINPIAAVKDSIINNLKQQQAVQLATKKAHECISELAQNKLSLAFTGADNINLLSQNSNIDAMAVRQIFSTPITKLPAYTSSINQQGLVVIYRINKQSINQGMVAQNKKMLEQYNANKAMIDFGSYLAALRSKFSVSYKADRLTATNNNQAAQQ